MMSILKDSDIASWSLKIYINEVKKEISGYDFKKDINKKLRNPGAVSYQSIAITILSFMNTAINWSDQRSKATPSFTNLSLPTSFAQVHDAGVVWVIYLV